MARSKKKKKGIIKNDNIQYVEAIRINPTKDRPAVGTGRGAPAAGSALPVCECVSVGSYRHTVA